MMTFVTCTGIGFLLVSGLLHSITTYALSNVLYKRELVPALITGKPGCYLAPKDAFINNTLSKLLKVDKKSLIEFTINIETNASDDPMEGTRIALDLHKWMRITTSHGRTLAELQIKHDSMSSLTLSSNTAYLDVTLIDRPTNCFALLDENDKINAIKYLLVRDFIFDGPVTLSYDDRICHRVIREHYDVAYIEVVCYTKDENTGEILEDFSKVNIWLTLLKGMLTAVRILLYFFGPLLFVPFMLSLVKQIIPYVVKLKKAVISKAIFFIDDYPTDTVPVAKKCLDLRNIRNMVKLQNSVRQVIFGQPTDIKITQLEISVDYRRTMPEGEVYTGLLETIFDAFFKCSIRNIEPFKSCCFENTLNSCCCCRTKTYSWNRCCYYMSVLLFVLLIHVPFGVRLVVFYVYEYGDILFRKNALSRLGLSDNFDGSLLKYLLPTHPFFIFIYLFYFLTAINVAIASNRLEEGRFMKVILSSFQDLHSLEWTEVCKVAMSNIIWPLKRFGLMGFLVGFIYWPIVIPLTGLLMIVYLIPSIYLIIRIFVHSITAITSKTRIHKQDKPYQSKKQVDHSVQIFDIARYSNRSSNDEKHLENQMKEICYLNIDALESGLVEEWHDTLSSTSNIVKHNSIRKVDIFMYIVAMLVGIITVISVVILLSEIVGSLIEFVIFIIMGILVNAAELLKYVVLVFTIVAYGLQCYNSVSTRYLKLNKSLFKTLGDILESDLGEITGMPEEKQENRGFKLNGEDVKSDEISTAPPSHWLIRDLVMFIDNHNVPRISRKLFEEVCLIKVPGIPGPVYESHLEATKQFLKILAFIFFLFVIVLTYGTVYNISHTNQMLATMAGGMLPLILKSLIKQPSVEVDFESVTFRNKLDNTIKNFTQCWPIRDFPFDVEPPQSSPGYKNAPTIQDLPTGEEQIQRLTGNMSSYLLREKCLSQRLSDESWPNMVMSLPRNRIDIAVYLPEENI